MTREEAWRRTKGYLYDALSSEETDEIIEALEQELCEDVVNREKVLDAIAKVGLSKNEIKEVQTISECLKEVEKLQPVTPQPKMGRWIVNKCSIYCSECGCGALYDKVYPSESVFGKAIRVKSTFCPTCGAMMVEQQTESEEV